MGEPLWIENVFRQANSIIAEHLEAAGVHDRADNFICECAEESCLGRLEVTIAEFRRIAAQANRYVVLPGHELADVEHLVHENERYAIVEKDLDAETSESDPLTRS